MKTEWDLDVNVVTFVLSDQIIERQQDNFPVILDLDNVGNVVEIEVILPMPLDDLKRVMDAISLGEVESNAILNTVSCGNMRALMFGQPTIPQSPYIADPNEETVKEFQVA
jgi:hypothetical protein